MKISIFVLPIIYAFLKCLIPDRRFALCGFFFIAVVSVYTYFSHSTCIFCSFICFVFFQVKFWSQHISFLAVGIIVVTSIRGLLITLTKVKERAPIPWEIAALIISSFFMKDL